MITSFTRILLLGSLPWMAPFVAHGAQLTIEKDGRSCTIPIADNQPPVVDPANQRVVIHVAPNANCPILSGESNRFTLTVNRSGQGAGRILSTPAGIDCRDSCSATFPANQTVILSAIPDSGSAFFSWMGDCTGPNTCALTMNAPRQVIAVFSSSNPSPSLTLSVNKIGTGSGTIRSTPNGIDCGTTCTAQFPQGTSITLSPTPDSGSTFTGWTGASCTGTGPCTLTINTNTNITATFSQAQASPPSNPCEGVEPPPGVRNRMLRTTVYINFRPPRFTVDATSFEHIFMRLISFDQGVPQPWPGQTTPRAVRIAKDSHIAAKFTVPANTNVYLWRLSFESQGDPDGSSVMQYLPVATISECPGNFNRTGPKKVHQNCYWPAAGGSMVMDIVDNAAQYSGRDCPIERGKTYYLNIAHLMPPDFQEPACDSPVQCSIAIQTYGYWRD